MTNIFTIINDIIFGKKGTILENVEDEDQFNGYLVNRWVSMYSPDNARVINETTNKYYNVFDNKREWYDYMVKIIPKGSPGRIHYIKKEKRKEVKNYDEIVKYLAKRFELSKREVQQYIDSGMVDLSNIKTALK
jgi:hypothetical protein|tara:strand:+ start:244 stop:645 length:402 start_codon:yes stop_codon:yes gene_type:complete